MVTDLLNNRWVIVEGVLNFYFCWEGCSYRQWWWKMPYHDGAKEDRLELCKSTLMFYKVVIQVWTLLDSPCDVATLRHWWLKWIHHWWNLRVNAQQVFFNKDIFLRMYKLETILITIVDHYEIQYLVLRNVLVFSVSFFLFTFLLNSPGQHQTLVSS